MRAPIDDLHCEVRGSGKREVGNVVATDSEFHVGAEWIKKSGTLDEELNDIVLLCVVGSRSWCYLYDLDITVNAFGFQICIVETSWNYLLHIRPIVWFKIIIIKYKTLAEGK